MYKHHTTEKQSTYPMNKIKNNKQTNELKALIGDKFIARNGKKVTFEDRIKGNDLVAIYFSAHWCPPCRKFTPLLTDVYEEWKEEGTKIEIIFVSSDQNEKSFKEYFEQQGDWLSYPFGSQQGKLLKYKFGVSGIPTLIVINKNGKVIDTKARRIVMQKGPLAVKSWM
eukprot:26664_1